VVSATTNALVISDGIEAVEVHFDHPPASRAVLRAHLTAPHRTYLTGVLRIAKVQRAASAGAEELGVRVSATLTRLEADADTPLPPAVISAGSATVRTLVTDGAGKVLLAPARNSPNWQRMKDSVAILVLAAGGHERWSPDDMHRELVASGVLQPTTWTDAEVSSLASRDASTVWHERRFVSFVTATRNPAAAWFTALAHLAAEEAARRRAGCTPRAYWDVPCSYRDVLMVRLAAVAADAAAAGAATVAAAGAADAAGATRAAHAAVAATVATVIAGGASAAPTTPAPAATAAPPAAPAHLAASAPAAAAGAAAAAAAAAEDDKRRQHDAQTWYVGVGAAWQALCVDARNVPLRWAQAARVVLPLPTGNSVVVLPLCHPPAGTPTAMPLPLSDMCAEHAVWLPLAALPVVVPHLAAELGGAAGLAAVAEVDARFGAGASPLGLTATVTQNSGASWWHVTAPP